MKQTLFGVSWEKTEESIDLVEPVLGSLKTLKDFYFGEFSISEQAQHAIESQNIENYRILSMINEYNKRNIFLEVVTKEQKSSIQFRSGIKTVDELLYEFPKTILEKQNRILELLVLDDSQIGEVIEIKSLYTEMFYSKNNNEFEFIINIMIKKELIEASLKNPSLTRFYYADIKILEKGWLIIEEKQKHENSKQAFIAISFNETMDSASEMIEKALSESGYTPFRIDNKEHNNEISGEILYEIKRCHFLIADVTQQKHGVYFEAGYAIGLGRPVIWCCKKDDFENVHFDTRQYNHIVWENPEELYNKLKTRIKGTILL